MQWPVDTAGSTVSTIITASGGWTASFHATAIPITFSIPCMQVYNICPGSLVLENNYLLDKLRYQLAPEHIVKVLMYIKQTGRSLFVHHVLATLKDDTASASCC
jgi:hypothetical protein